MSARGRTFRYVGLDVERDPVTLRCHYDLDGTRFTETIAFPDRAAPDDPRVDEAARLVFLLAGVSYYKASAPGVIEVGEPGLTESEHGFLRDFYVDGLGEYAYRLRERGIDVDLSGVGIRAPRRASVPAAPRPATALRPLVPFGGGIDSIVTVAGVRERTADVALFVAGRPGDRVAAIEAPAEQTGLPVVRAERALDPQILQSAQRGYLNGHVPVTGVLAAVAVLAAVLDGRDAVVMSNECSASAGNLEDRGRLVNHQWSKSQAFEVGFRAVLQDAVPGVEFFSWLRPFSELWVARRFAGLPRFHPTFRSCNKAFFQDPAARWDRWCGTCDKCAFIDLILSPFVAADRLGGIFDGREPLRSSDPGVRHKVATLVGLTEDSKAFECVGDVGECRAALLETVRRPDRRADGWLHELADELRGTEVPDVATLLAPLGPHQVPERYAPDDLLG